MITLEKLFKAIGYEEIHELSPFSIVDNEGSKGTVLWADSESIGVRLGRGEHELQHENLDWIYIKNLHLLIKGVWELH